MPELSVVIAAYNAERTLQAQLDALASQDAELTWEVLVCDNGSTDRTAELVRSAAATQPWLRLVDASARRGPGAARNAGARDARAPLLAFCDADDVVADGWLQAMKEALDGAVLVTGRSRRPELNSRPDEPQHFSWGIYRLPAFPYLPGAGAGNMAVHRQAFLDVGGFDESMRTGEDLDFCWRMQLAGHVLVEQPRAVVDVSNREGLTATFRQAFAYGVGDKRLKHKYALVEAAFLDGEAGQSQAETPETEANPHGAPQSAAARHTRFAARLWRKLRSTRRLSDLTNVSHRAATWLGYRCVRIDRSTPQITPPAVLPNGDELGG